MTKMFEIAVLLLKIFAGWQNCQPFNTLGGMKT
jgi:hypothetical protein